MITHTTPTTTTYVTEFKNDQSWIARKLAPVHPDAYYTELSDGGNLRVVILNVALQGR
jgi:hypothetical protein